jgi:hypothetical protein
VLEAPLSVCRDLAALAGRRPGSPAKAPVKPDALQTLARATNHLPNRSGRFSLVTPEFREELLLANATSYGLYLLLRLAL